jgi:glycosyltransferase involved in cell wall biosynthesis
MRSLHVAALPFPTQQGTQAAVHAMLSALSAAGQAPELLCYAHGVPAPRPPYRLHRLARSLGVSSLRSGPSLPKLALDLLLVRELRALAKTRRPEWVVAHHVEAALACAAAGLSRFAFVAHTSLAAELKFFFPARLAPVCDRLGSALDRYLCRRATHAFAVSPLLAAQLQRSSGVPVHPLSIPWRLPEASRGGDRAAARRALGLVTEDEVILYAGNLDAYQGLSALLASVELLARERPRVVLLLATQAAPAELAKLVARGVRVRHTGLADEDDRRRAHAAADVVAVPRASAGGLPVKLLDALARGTHVVASQRAAAGLVLGTTCTLVEDDNPHAFARALARDLTQPDRTRARRARAYVARAHDDASFIADLSRVLHGEQAASARSSTDPLVGDGKVR